MVQRRFTPPGQAADFDEQREQMHRQLFSAVSHDLKTPLASMIGSLEIHQRMREKLSQEKRDALIATALEEAYRLDNFVTNILDMSKLESGMVKIRKEHVNLQRLLKDCLTNLDNRLKHTQVDVAGEEGVTAQTDPSLLARALSLVLDNAVKYGGTPPSLVLRYGKQDEHTVFISVQDNGKGVPADQYEKVFEKYTRFTKSDLQSAGTGLGLAICREIMRLLGGTVRVVTPDGGGALFTLSFPLA